MSTPNYLKKGDKVAVLCPASYISEDLSPAYAVLESWGLELVIYESTTSQDHYFAGNDALRARDLQRALDDESIKAIIAGRGGYGCVRIVDLLNFEKFKQNPKWLVGFSDVTVLHSHIQHNYQIPTIHGQMVKTFLDGTPASLETLRCSLFGENNDLKYTYNDFPNRDGESTGILTGGNLAILQSILASDSDVDYANKILFIEEVGEIHYNIDRMLWTLKRANKLSHLKGLIIGGFTELRDTNPTFGQRYEEIIMAIVQDYNYPVAFGYPAGHIENNQALTFGRNVNLKVEGEYVQLIYLD